MKALQFIVAYKDSPSRRTQFFGPFGSKDVAEYFSACLPVPLAGGFSRINHIQPLQAGEGRVINNKIQNDRLRLSEMAEQ
jgi:hypothetical protein